MRSTASGHSSGSTTGFSVWHCFKSFNLRKNPILQPDDSPTSCTLRLTIFPLTRRPFSQGSLHADGSTLPVNVLPLEPDVFAGPHSSGDGNSKQSPVHRRQRNFQESLGLLYTEDSHLAPSNPWQLHAFGRNLQNHFPLQRLSERRVEHPMSALDRSWRKSAICHLLVNRLDVQRPDCHDRLLAQRWADVFCEQTLVAFITSCCRSAI